MKLNLWQQYGKTIMSALLAVATVAIPLWSGDNHIDPSEGIIIALGVGNAVLVYVVPITKSFAGVKSLVNAVMASLLVAQTYIAGGIDSNDWLLILAAGLAVLGVTVAPAYSPKEHVLVTAGSDTPVAV
jgi:hypothetical protein